MNDIQAIAERLKELRIKNNLEQVEVAEYLGYKSNTTISKWENAKNLPTGGKLAKLAELFNTSTDYILYGDNSTAPQSPTDELTQALMDTVGQLSPDGKKTVLSHAREVLEREEDARTLAEPELFKIYYVSEVEAGPTGYSYDDLDQDYCYTDEEPPRYDIATKVHGWSMAPDYDEGDILYLRDYGTSHYSGQECVVVVDDRNYFKKVYTTDTGLLLVSINDDKDTYPDFEIPFPPEEDTHIKIFNVVGSFTPVEG